MEVSKVLIIDTIVEGDGLPVPADVRTASKASARPVIVVCPGFLAYRRWGFFPYVSERIALAGFHVVTLTFSHGGTDDVTGRIARPGEFAANSVSKEIEDLERVLRWVSSPEFPLRASPARGLLGHSRGGSVSILAAAGFPEVGAIVTWSTPSRLDRYTDRRKVEWKRTGFLEFTDPRADEPLRLDYSYYEDIDSNRDRFDVGTAAASLSVPHLVVHGERDAAVSISEADAFFERPSAAAKSFERIPGCGHVFGVTHPMEKPTPALERAVSVTVDWFAGTIGKESGESWT